MIGRIAFALFCLVTTMARADAVECATKPGAHAYWQYRNVDGRKCWYPGRHIREKSELSWAADRIILVHAAVTSVSEQEPMAAPPADFTARWIDPPPASALPQQVYDRLDEDVLAGRSFAPVRSARFDAAVLYTERPRSPTAVVASSMSSVGSSLMSLGWILLVSSILAVFTSMRSAKI